MSFDCRKQVIVIGAGIGGLTTAVRLAAIGYHVRVFESQPQVGGKLNCIKMQGFSFDTGPSLITMPGVLHDLFQAAGRRLEEYLHLIPHRIASVYSIIPYIEMADGGWYPCGGICTIAEALARLARELGVCIETIYGLSSNQRLAPFVRPDNRARDIKHLYFVGGSTHPGGGVPLVMLSGKIVAEMIAQECPTI